MEESNLSASKTQAEDRIKKRLRKELPPYRLWMWAAIRLPRNATNEDDMSKTTSPKQTYTITSGEGSGEGTTETVRMTEIGLKLRLTKERCGGDRWAFARDTDGDRLEF